MSELQRLEADPNADPELSRLFRAGTPPIGIDAGSLERSRVRVHALMAAPAGVAGLVWIKHAALGAALGVTVAVAAAAPRLVQHFRGGTPTPTVAAKPALAQRSAAVTSAAKPVASAPPSAPARVAPSAEVLRPPSALPGAPARPADASPNALDTLRRESALLEAARAALESEPASALRLLAQHEREFLNGTLAVEREFLTVSALVRMGERAQAESRAAALRARAPGSLYQGRLDRLLGHGAHAP